MKPKKKNIARGVANYVKKKGLPANTAVTFEDVAIIDQYSAIPSRSDEYIDTGSDFGKGIILKRPIFSANMDTITESRMAIAMARLGGCGVIHQFLPLEHRIAAVEKVKRADSFVVKTPLTISPRAAIRDARTLTHDYQISGLIVVDDNSGEVVGLLSGRDIRWASDNDEIKNRMTPLLQLVTAPSDISIEDAKRILYEKRLEKLPLLGDDKKCVGLITASDILKLEQFHFAFRDPKGRLGVAAAAGLGKDILKEAEKLLEAGIDILVVDTARGNSKRLRDAVKSIRKKLGDGFLLVAGNIDTPEGAGMLYDAGADVVKEGIGGGAACKTREGPGVGIPQITAIARCAAVADLYKKSFIADGGIKGPADYCKALAAGADAVMIGGLLAGTEETPGKAFFEDGRQWKIFRGSASLEFQVSRLDREETEDRVRAPEGIARRVEFKGSVTQVINELVGYQLSSMSYVGAKNMKEFHRKARFQMQTTSGYEEGKPHEVF